MFGPEVRELTYCVAEGVKRGTIDGGMAKLILARVLPSSRPVQIDLPEMTGPRSADRGGRQDPGGRERWQDQPAGGAERCRR